MPYIHFPHRAGLYSRQAHADLPEQAPYEREVSRQGFFGPASHIHHRHPPTGWCDWQGELRPRAYRLQDLESRSSSPWAAPVILANDFCRYRFWCCPHSMSRLARNADGDDLLFLHQGEAELFCDYGHLSLVQGDYLLLPRGTMWRLHCEQPLQCLLIEATNDAYQLPEKGLLGQHAIFDTAALAVPAIDDVFLDQQNESRWQLELKRNNSISLITYPFNPLDALGWHGEVSAVKINWRDIRPVMSHRYHIPPSVHATFVAERFVVCTFVPRPIESDPGALKVPFYHSNEDYDEILFYHSGDFFSRDNIDAGMLTFHPSGFSHGPHPKAYQAAQRAEKTFTDEVAVMVDTRDAMLPSELAGKVEVDDYVMSWQDHEAGD